jgi:predicted MFS family arabinose efflux permease
VIGALTAASATGQLAFLPFIAWLASNHGWKSVSIAIAAATVAVIPLVLVFARNGPESVGLLRYGATGEEPPPPPRQNPIAAAFGALRLAVGTRNFWLLAGSFFICGATSTGLIGTHFLPHSTDEGISEATAAVVLAIMGGMNFVGTIASGWLTDRYDPRKLLASYYVFRGLSLFLLPFVTSAQGLAVCAIFFGLDYIATVPPTVSLAADIFGRRNIGTVFGWIFAAHMIGAAVAAWLGGLARDSLGDYQLAFLTAGAIALVGGMLSLRINREERLVLEPSAIAT